MRQRDLKLILFSLLLVSGRLPAQEPGPATVEVIPGARYAASGLHRFFFGAHYRQLWTTPVQAERLDLATFAGGLRATERGGGQQTRSLRFHAADGREFAFRSVDKDPTAVIPPELRGTVASSIVQDQISSSHPAGALVVPPLLEAAGVPHTEPRYVVLPDDARLGEFRAEFAGQFGLFEERPSADTDGTIVPGALRVISSDVLIERVEQSPDDQVDMHALATARLMDVFLGDWDRHRDQWRWATFDSARPRHWVAIPRDRDQAFVRFDGLLLAIARGPAPQLVNFGPKYPAMDGLTWNGRELDRRFLVGLERSAWDSIALVLQRVLTDSVIDAAVRRLPPSYAPLDSARLAHGLRGRRDRLPQAARAFYRLLAGEVDIHATDKSDVARAEAAGRHSVRVTIARHDDSTPWFDRTFHAVETREIRIYLHGGADQALATGPSLGGIAVRFIGGGGADQFADSVERGGARFYDADSTTVAGRGVSLDDRAYNTGPKRSATALPPRDWGSRTLPIIWASAGPDVGLLVGGGLMWTDYGFRQQPFASQHTLRAAYATGAQTAKAEYLGAFHGEGRRTYATARLLASGIETIRFHGFGNETVISNSSTFYRVRQLELRFEPSLVVPLSSRTTLAAGPMVQYTDTRSGNRFINQSGPYGSGRFGLVGARANLLVDTRDTPGNATRGVVLEAGTSIVPQLWDVRSTFAEVHGSASTYLGARHFPTQPVLALRVGGKQVLGTAPYAEAAYIGNARTVRLGRENRYGGDAAVWGSAELRLTFGGFRFVVPGVWGIHGLGDIGRVFLDGESSDTWHGAYGGGLWFGFLGRGNTVSVSWAQSEERGSLYFQAGMAY